MNGTDGIKQGHDWQDRQSWLMHQEAVRMLQADPTLCDKALATLARWDTHVCSRSRPLRERWVQIIGNRDWAAALDTSEVGNQLRQASPLSCLLSDGVRRAILAQVQQEKAFQAEMLEWDSMAPVGAEFGSPEHERLSELDHLAFIATGSLEAARVWLDTPNPDLDGMTPEDCARTASGFERVRSLLETSPLLNPSGESPTRVYTVKASWDGDAGVWVATSDDVPGLVTEAASWDELDTKLVSLVPELLTHNGLIQEGTAVRIVLVQVDTGLLSPPAASEEASSGQCNILRCHVTTDPVTGWLVGSVQDLASAHTQGQTLDELKANMHEVLAMLQEHETVRTRRDIPHLNLPAGASGVVIHTYPKGVAYEVEFITEDGQTVGVETLRADELIPSQGNTGSRVQDDD